MNKKWKIASILGIVSITSCIYIWGIPAIVNIEHRKANIETAIYESSGYKIDLGNPDLSMGTFPSVWLESDNISVLNDDNSKAISIENPKVKIKLFPLLFKKIEIAKLSATKEEINFIFNKDSKFQIGQYPIEISKKDKTFTLSKMIMDLGEYNISLDDQKNSKSAKLNGEYFKLGKYVANKNLKFATKNTLTVGNESANIFADVEVNLPIDMLTEDKIKIDANIDNLDLSMFSDYISIWTNGGLKDLDGLVNFSANTTTDKYKHKNITTKLVTNNLKIIGKDKVASVIYPDTLTANINFDTVNNGINFEDTTVKSKNIDFTVNGKVFDIGNKAPKYNIEGEVKNTRLADIVALFPWTDKILPDFNLYKLKEHGGDGLGNAKIRFQGQGNKPNVTGFAKLEDLYVLHPIKGATGNANVDMKFTGKHMLINVFVPAGENQSVTVSGKAWLDGSKYSELQVKSTDAIPLAPAQEVLVPLHDILKFQLGPIPMMKVAGYGKVEAHSAGKKVDPHMWGRVDFWNAKASFLDVKNLEVVNGIGEVVFDDRTVTFKTKQGFINGKPVSIHGNSVVLGELNVFVESKNQNIQKLVRTINSSPILIDVQKAIEPFTQPSGLADVFLHIYGTVKNPEEVVFNEDLFSKGTVILHNARTVMQDTFQPFTNVNGTVKFDQYNSEYDVTGNLRKSRIHVVGTGTSNSIDLIAHSDRIQMRDVFDTLHPDMLLPYKNEIGKIYGSFNAKYKGPAESGQIDYNKLIVDGNLFSNMSTSNPIRFNGGTFTIKNGLLKTSNLNGLFNNTPCSLSFTAKDLDKEDFSIAQAVFNFKDFDISAVDTIKKQVKLPKDIETLINDVSDMQGIIDINGYVKNNQIHANTNLKDTSFYYKPLEANVKILNGNANMYGTTLQLDKINSRVSSMPVFVNGKISNIYSSNPNLNLSLSAKLTQKFFDRFFNLKTVYPVKTKGDINFYTKLKGPINALRSQSTLNLDENSSIYYMGATLSGAPTGAFNTEGLTTNPVSIITDATIYDNNKVKLHSLKYNQTITAQNKKTSVQNQLTASGELSLLKDNVINFNNFKIKTKNPTNARIFNVLFKKPTIKQGVFTSDLTINGTSLAPEILGTLNITSIDIPLLDATIRDINVDFKKDFINMDTKAVVLTNEMLAKIKILNKVTTPLQIEDVDIKMDSLNLNVISEAMNDFEADSTRNQLKTETLMLQPGVLLIKKARIAADNVLIKKVEADNFKANITLGEDQVFRIKDYSFDIANGKVTGNANYNLKNYKSFGEMHIDKAEASIVAENFFDMPGQMYGTVSGDLKAGCTGFSSVDCINTLYGEGSFNVSEGRMPKLGSLEYLLKAGNLITGGITGVSINGIIDQIGRAHV